MQTQSLIHAKVWLLLVGIVILTCDSTSCAKLEDPQKSVRLCGNRLVDAVLELCNYRIHDPKVKRDIEVHDSDEEPEALASPNATETRLTHTLHKSHVFDVLKRSARGIVNECCRNRCTINDLMLYCAVEC